MEAENQGGGSATTVLVSVIIVVIIAVAFYFGFWRGRGAPVDEASTGGTQVNVTLPGNNNGSTGY